MSVIDYIYIYTYIHIYIYTYIKVKNCKIVKDNTILCEADRSNEVGPTTLTQDDIDEAVNIIILLTIYHVQNTTESTNKQQYYKYCIGLLSNLIDTVSP
jgi:hypothetical protein